MIYYHQNCHSRLRQQLANCYNQALVIAHDRLELTTDLDVYCVRVTHQPVRNEKVTGSSQESGVIICKILDPVITNYELIGFFLHELNHIRQGQLFSIERHPSLFNWVLTEGLAIAFERELRIFPPLLDIPPSRDKLKTGLRQILGIGESNDWNYYDWFYNYDQQSPLPINFAYHIGEWLVANFCRQRHITPSQAINISPSEFHQFAEELCAK